MARVPASRLERYACTVSVAQPLQYGRLSRGRLRTAHRPLRLASSIGSVKTTAAAAALTLHPDPPAVQLHEAFRERESEPRALRGGGARPRLARSCLR